MSACLRTAAPPTILSPFTHVGDFCFHFRSCSQKLRTKAITTTFAGRGCVFVGMAYSKVNSFPQERCNCRAGSKMGLTAVLLVALLVTLCAIRRTTLGPSRQYKNALRRNLDEGEVTTDGLLSSFNFSGSGDGEPSDCKTKGSTIVANALDRLETISTHCTTTVSLSDCCQLKFLQQHESGIYKIAGRDSYCDMTTDGGGWLVILRRAGGKRAFNKPWKKYQKGFGILDQDFWLGLDAMHELTTLAFTELRVDLQHWNGTEIYAHYSTFHVAGLQDNYRLTVGDYDNRSTADASLTNGMQFSTIDRDNDEWGGSCTRLADNGGWWYWRCGGVFLTESYFDRNGSPVGISWWTNMRETRYARAEMKIRPKAWHCGNIPLTI